MLIINQKFRGGKIENKLIYFIILNKVNMNFFKMVDSSLFSTGIDRKENLLKMILFYKYI